MIITWALEHSVILPEIIIIKIITGLKKAKFSSVSILYSIIIIPFDAFDISHI